MQIDNTNFLVDLVWRHFVQLILVLEERFQVHKDGASSLDVKLKDLCSSPLVLCAIRKLKQRNFSNKIYLLACRRRLWEDEPGETATMLRADVGGETCWLPGLEVEIWSALEF
jgi:hypothetical protein